MIVYWVITDHVKKLYVGVTFAHDLLCASFLLQPHLTSNEVLKWTDTSKRKYKFKLLNYFEIHPRYSSKKYFDDLGKYLPLRLRRINREARTTIYLASWKTFMAKERYGVVSWQEVKKNFFGSTDSDALSSKKNFPPKFSWCVYLTSVRCFCKEKFAFNHASVRSHLKLLWDVYRLLWYYGANWKNIFRELVDKKLLVNRKERW